MMPGDSGIIDCIDINDEDYHRRINSMGLRCDQRICVLRRLFGNLHCAVGKYAQTEMAIRERDALQILVDRK
jgi:Fe2+ transport system protein FeoA